MVEYVFDTTLGTLRLFTDSEYFCEENPELETCEEIFDLIVVYLKERDDTLAKSLIKAYVKSRFFDILKKVKDVLNKVEEVETEVVN